MEKIELIVNAGGKTRFENPNVDTAVIIAGFDEGEKMIGTLQGDHTEVIALLAATIDNDKDIEAVFTDLIGFIMTAEEGAPPAFLRIRKHAVREAAAQMLSRINVLGKDK